MAATATRTALRADAVPSSREPGWTAFVRFSAIAAISSLPIAAGNLVTALFAVDFNLDALSNPLVLMQAGPAGAALWRWSMILDLFGYYLLIVPLIRTLHTQLRPTMPAWIDLSALLLLAYCLIGAMGATVLASVTPPLIIAHSGAPQPERLALEIVADSYSNAVYRGLWNVLEELLAGIGWLGFGLALVRSRRALGVMTCLLGLACLVDSLGSILNVEAVAMAGLTVYLVAAPLWACWTGMGLLRSLHQRN